MSQRTQSCTKQQAATRMGQARAYLDVAEMVADDDTDESLRGVAAGLAVLAGIAASDAACCHALGERSRGDSHHEAEKLLKSIGGDPATAAATALRRLINLKGQAHYGFATVSAKDRKTALNAAGRVVAFAEEALQS